MSSKSFLEIVTDDDVIRWQFTDPDTKQVYDSIFNLRVVPEALKRSWDKKFTEVEITRRGREEKLDTWAFIEQCLDYAIVSWENVQRQGVDLPCTREWKVRLPEVVKAAIIRLCVGKELGAAVERGVPGLPSAEASAAPSRLRAVEDADPN